MKASLIFRFGTPAKRLPPLVCDGFVPAESGLGKKREIGSCRSPFEAALYFPMRPSSEHPVAVSRPCCIVGLLAGALLMLSGVAVTYLAFGGWAWAASANPGLAMFVVLGVLLAVVAWLARRQPVLVEG